MSLQEKYPKPKLAMLPGEEETRTAVRGGGWKASLYKERVSRFQKVTRLLEESLLEEKRKKAEKKREILLRQRQQQQQQEQEGKQGQAIGGPAHVRDGEGAIPSPEGNNNDDDILTLDSVALMGVVGAQHPAEVVAAQIEDMDFGHVNKEGFDDFVKLKRIQAGENRLRVEDFTAFPSLSTLELQSNLITALPPLVGVLRHLQTLSLAHNSVPAKDLTNLASLPHLRALDLSYNNLKHFPPHFGELSNPFPELETLILSHNQLVKGHVFAACAGLLSLTYLALDGNKLKFIPKLVADDTLPDVQPFPKLELLTLNSNAVASASHILQCKLWPSLKELQLLDTPFSRSFRRLPASVQQLVDEKRIAVIWREERENAPSLQASIAKDGMVTVDASLPIIKPPTTGIGPRRQRVLPSRAPLDPLPALPPSTLVRSSHEPQILVITDDAAQSDAGKDTEHLVRHTDAHHQEDQEASQRPDRSRQSTDADRKGREEEAEARKEQTELKTHNDGGVFLTALLGDYGVDIYDDGDDDADDDGEGSEDGGAVGDDGDVDDDVQSLSEQSEGNPNALRRKKRALPRPRVNKADIRVPQSPFVGVQHQSLRQYQKKRTKPKPTAATLGLTEAKRLLGLDPDDKGPKRQRHLSNEELLKHLDLLKACPEVERDDHLPSNEAIHLDALKFRGCEELLMDSSEDEADPDGNQDDESMPVGVRHAVKALRFALDHPLKLSSEARQRLRKPSRRHESSNTRSIHAAMQLPAPSSTGAIERSALLALPAPEETLLRVHSQGPPQPQGSLALLDTAGDRAVSQQRHVHVPTPPSSHDVSRGRLLNLNATSTSHVSLAPRGPDAQPSNITTPAPRSRQRLLHLQRLLSNLSTPQTVTTALAPSKAQAGPTGPHGEQEQRVADPRL